MASRPECLCIHEGEEWLVCRLDASKLLVAQNDLGVVGGSECMLRKENILKLKLCLGVFECRQGSSGLPLLLPGKRKVLNIP
jgi:hypothetical protein